MNSHRAIGESKGGQSTLMMVAIILALGFVVHSFMVTNAFKTMDDMASIVNNDLIKSTDNISRILKTSYFGDKSYWRPMVFLTYMLEYALFGLNPYYYYLVNLFVHLLSSLVIFLLLRLFFTDKWTPFWAALLFVTHPIHWEAVSNIPGRSILLSAFFFFVAFYFYCLNRKNPRVIYWVMSLMSFVASLMSKESGAMLPVVICSYLFFIERPRKEERRRAALSVTPYFGLLAIYIVIRRILGIVSLFFPRTLEQSWLGFMSFLRSVVTHVRLFYFPYDLHFDRSRELYASFGDPSLLATAALFVLIGALVFLMRRRISSISFFFLSWFCIDLIPVSQLLVSIGTQAGRISTAEHFLYSASVGVFVLSVRGCLWVFEQNQQRKIIQDNVLKFAFMGIYLFYALMTIQQNIISASELAMLKQSLRYNPENVRMIESYGFALVTTKQFEEGEKQFRRVLEHNPHHVRARISLGKVLCDLGRCAEGMLEYEKVGDAKDLSELLERNKQATYEVVLKEYEDLLIRDPKNARVYYSIGIIYAKTQRLKEAVEFFGRAVALEPDFKEALFNLANVYEGLGDKERARYFYEEMLAVGGEKTELDTYAESRLLELRR